jgi:ribosomal protein S18 acetylase RimI-like enzyme
MNDSAVYEERKRQLAGALAQVTLPEGIAIRPWTEADVSGIQRISSAEGWPSPTERPDDTLFAWQHSWPALVAIDGETVVGFVRGLTDGAISIYIAEMAVDAQQRGRGIGRALLDTCHFLYPTTRLDLLSVDDAQAFYKACGFRAVYQGMRKSYV